jgi:hypothetical protein
MLKTVVSSQQAEELMQTFAEEHFERGRQHGKAEALLRILAVRGIPVDDASRQRIVSCTDMATLDQWFERALKAHRVSELFEGLAQ